jgi:hypothetical protein
MASAEHHERCSLAFPHVYQGEITSAQHPSTRRSVMEAAGQYDVPPLIDRVGGWAISRSGLHSLTAAFVIPAAQLGEASEQQVSGKAGVDPTDFPTALERARTLLDLGYLG